MIPQCLLLQVITVWILLELSKKSADIFIYCKGIIWKYHYDDDNDIICQAI